jgi:hypothetical protein
LTALTIHIELGIFQPNRLAGSAGENAVVADGFGPWSQV